MGKILDTVMALILVFSVVGLFANSVIYNASTDENRTTFSTYSANASSVNNTQVLQDANYSSYDSGDLTSNFQAIAIQWQTEIADAQKGLQSGNVVDMIGSAFGLAASLTMNIVFVILAVIGQGYNFTAGIISNLTDLPAPWNVFGYIGWVALIMLFIYLVIKAAETAIGRPI